LLAYAWLFKHHAMIITRPTPKVTFAVRNVCPLHLVRYSPLEGGLMSNNKEPHEKMPGENPDGTYHFNPGNMAGKTPGDPKQTASNRGEDVPDEKPAE
jgi:hypothetical protein